ncbi:hypothetical protein [Streptacidiphilus jiangxiensis]|uniref:PknH-like extracellular domain-containing protein n=1 Tax=Streptacidiphilus jiangxiensis TaxID=235985 RepID=A0A1H7J8Q5_STRJI|nr:hypothetical protein [Streptacidiphilus jiangxiensis]SEK70652.1 hypothetical protein SAMN05414137_103178 [Streptacidiphilus jiangxiensis]
MRALRSSRAAKFAAVAAVALGLAAGATGTANAAGHTSPWLTGAQMPQASAFHWQTQGRPDGGFVGNGDFQWLFTCGPTGPLHALHVSAFAQQAFATKVHRVEGGQTLLRFSSAAKAKAALKVIESDYANCAQRIDRGPVDYDLHKHVHASVDRTAWIQQGIAYRLEIRNAAGRPGNIPDLPTDAQEFFVQRGNTISFVQIEGTNAHLDATAGSLNVLKTMAARLG